MVGNRWQTFSAVAMCASLVATGACGRNGGDANNADSATTATASGDVARDTTAGATAGAAATTPGSAGGTSSMSITGGDPEIIQVLATVDQGEIADGQMAQRMAKNAQVKALARTLVTEHTASLQKDRQLAKTANVQLMNATGGMSGGSGTSKAGTSDSASKTGVNPGSQGTSGGSMSNVAMQLQTMHQQTSERLSGMQGAAFDSAFVNAQVMGHQQVLTLLQGAASQGQNSAVSQHLADATKHVQDHLERAQKLQQSLTSGSTGTGDSTSKSGTASDTGRKPN
jgi:putative membrane protein